MKTTFNSPIIGVPIEIHYDTFDNFEKYWKSQTSSPIEKGLSGFCCILEKEDKSKILMWFRNTNAIDDDKYLMDTIAHESFHAVCKIRRMMYSLGQDNSDELIIVRQNEEDWAYLFGEIVFNISRVVSDWSMQETLKRGLNAKKKEQTSAEDK
jgi:hypothetical protein